MDLTYRTVQWIDDLAINECTIRAAARPDGARWWQLWTWVVREDGGGPFYVGVPVHLAPYTDHGPGGKTWGLARVAAGVWQGRPVHRRPGRCAAGRQSEAEPVAPDATDRRRAGRAALDDRRATSSVT